MDDTNNAQDQGQPVNPVMPGEPAEKPVVPTTDVPVEPPAAPVEAPTAQEQPGGAPEPVPDAPVTEVPGEPTDQGTGTPPANMPPAA